MRHNPFHVLGLPTTATVDEIVARSQELAELAKSDDERRAVVDAQRALITHPAERRAHQLLEVPDTTYRGEQWATFEHHNRRAPVNRAALTADAVPLRRTDLDMHALVTEVLDDLMRPPAVDIRPALENPPVLPAAGTFPIEVRDVLFG